MEGPGQIPVVAVSCCLKQAEFGGVHSVGDKYVDAVVDGAGCVPLLVPALSDRLDLDSLLQRVDGLMLTGSPSNVEPHHYGHEPPPDGSARDSQRDGTTLPLIRAAVDQGMPLLAICRGIQELNVALGGSLHQEVHAVPGRVEHRSNKSVPYPDRYGPAHPVRLRAGGVLQAIVGGRETMTVNSLHAQAIDRLAPGLVVEASADDGTIEAVAGVGMRGFCLGVQWHPEWRVREHPLNLAIFEAFGRACRDRVGSGSGRDRLGIVA